MQITLDSRSIASYHTGVNPFYRPSSILLATGIACMMAPAAQARQHEEANRQAYTQLVQALQAEIELLQGVKDAASAAAALAPMQEIGAKLEGLYQIAPDNQSFSLYVLRTDERKAEITHLLLQLAAQKQRLIKLDCYGQGELSSLLKNQH